MNSTISVALCTYNGARYIEQQLTSILDQSVPPDEIIVCDDGSQDQTCDIVRGLAQAHPAIRLVQNPARLGVTRNFEQAIRLTSGELVLLSDQDDVWLPERVMEMRRIFDQQPDVALVYANFAFVDEQLRPIPVTHGQQFQASALPRVPRTVIKNWANLLACTLAFRAALKPLLLPFPDHWSHDAWITLLGYVLGEVRQTETVVMLYRLHTASSSGNIKYTGSLGAALRTKISRSQLVYYSEETARWAALVDRLDTLRAAATLTPEQRAGLDLFLPEAQRRADFAARREALKRRARPWRVGAALRLLLRGDYHRYLNGVLTFGKDILLV